MRLLPPQGDIDLAILNKKYTDVQDCRMGIKTFLDKWARKLTATVAVFGDSIVAYQNSELLSVEEQKTAPCGLCGNSWVRQIWQLLNYNTYGENGEILNKNGNMGFKRFDHADWIISNGYAIGDIITTEDWATNKITATDAWRKRTHGSATQTIMPDSSYGKPMIGTKINGATAVVTIPSEAIGFSVIFGTGVNPQLSIANIKTNNGTTDVVNENVTMNFTDANEKRKVWTLTAGTEKTITITNTTTEELWVWGVEYWTGTYVKVFNIGSAGSTVSGLYSISATSVTPLSADLIIFETPILNDTAQITLADSYTNARSLFDVFGITPVLACICHRGAYNNPTIQFDRHNLRYNVTVPEGTKIVGNRYFFPDYVKNYKILAHKYSYGIMDIFSKSVDAFGGLSTDLISTDYLLDWGHLGPLGNKWYVDEFKKVIMLDDTEI